jgi:NADPH:quinone reductase-like Zn-dependent oxidoreductase
MRAVVITEPGESEVMQWLDVPDPSPGPGEVVIGCSYLTPWSEAAGRGDRLGG